MLEVAILVCTAEANSLSELVFTNKTTCTRFNIWPHLSRPKINCKIVKCLNTPCMSFNGEQSPHESMFGTEHLLW